MTKYDKLIAMSETKIYFVDKRFFARFKPYLIVN